MLTLKELEPRVHEITLEGVIEKSDIDTARRELAPLLDGDAPIGLVIRAEALTDMTGDAIVEDLRYEFSLLPKWSKIARLALVTDKQAFSAILRWIAPVLPMIDMRVFPSSEVDAARAFAADLPPVPAPPGPGIRMLADGRDGVIAWELDGHVSREDVAQIFAPLEKLTAGGRKVNLLVRIKSYDGFDMSLLTDADFLGAKFGAIRHIGRYALVGAPDWMSGLLALAGPMMPFEIRQFDFAEEDAARQWVGLS